MNKPNKITHTFYMLLTCIATLSLITYVIPESIFTSYALKKVDFIEPLVQKKETPERLTTKVIKRTQKPNKKTKSLPKPEGLITLEDYSPNNANLTRLMSGLYQTKLTQDTFRIAFFGDSFIEGDIVTKDFRDSLQAYFGGNGIGFLPVQSEVSMFRKSMPSEGKEWNTISLANPSKTTDVGISGSVFIPNPNAQFKIFPPETIKGLHLLYQNNIEQVKFRKTVNYKLSLDDTLLQGSGLQMKQLLANTDSVKQFKLEFPSAHHLQVYGLYHAEGPGVYVDNYSFRGNSGLGLMAIKDSQFVRFQKVMHYQFVILQFGLNATKANTTDFTNYEKRMVKMIQHLKTLMPQAIFMLVSTSDRSYKQNGEFITMPSIPLLVEAQRRIAFESEILFWDMFQAMGGENSMVKLVREKKANKDYTHLNFEGGTFVADKLYKAMIYEFKNYQTNIFNEKTSIALY